MGTTMKRREPGNGLNEVAEEIDAAVADGSLSPDDAAQVKQTLSAEIARLLDRIRRP